MPIEGRKEICLDRELLRIVQEVSRLEQKVTKLFELLRDPVYRYLTLVLRNRSDAEDLTQESSCGFTRVWPRAKPLKT